MRSDGRLGKALMNIIRNIGIAYILALVCAGPIPLWAHQVLEHGNCGDCKVTDQAKSSCNDCAYCSHRSSRTSAKISEERGAPLSVVSSASACHDCFFCFQYSQSSLGSQSSYAQTSNDLIELTVFRDSSVPVFVRTGFLGPRGPPALILPALI